MSTEPDDKPTPAAQSGGLRISLDWWAVISALVLILLILSGVIPNVLW